MVVKFVLNRLFMTDWSLTIEIIPGAENYPDHWPSSTQSRIRHSLGFPCSYYPTLLRALLVQLNREIPSIAISKHYLQQLFLSLALFVVSDNQSLLSRFIILNTSRQVSLRQMSLKQISCNWRSKLRSDSSKKTKKLRNKLDLKWMFG